MQNKLFIGSDPEMVWIDRNTGVPANISEVSSAATISVGGADGLIGADGASGSSRTSELRPPATDNPISHFENIKELIELAYHSYYKITNGRYIIVSSTSTIPTGGHIHFGHPTLKNNLELQSKCASNLDYWVAPLVLPFFNKRSILTRYNHGYGTIHDYRSQPWGFEYRTLPSWLVDPVITKGILCLSYIVVQATIDDKIIRRVRGRDTRWIEKYFNTESFDELIEMRTKTIPILISQSRGSGYYKPIMDMLKKLQEVPKTLDIFDNWGFKVDDYNLNIKTATTYWQSNVFSQAIEYTSVDHDKSLIKYKNVGDFSYPNSFTRRPFTRHTASLDKLIILLSNKYTAKNIAAIYPRLSNEFNAYSVNVLSSMNTLKLKDNSLTVKEILNIEETAPSKLKESHREIRSYFDIYALRELYHGVNEIKDLDMSQLAEALTKTEISKELKKQYIESKLRLGESKKKNSRSSIYNSSGQYSGQYNRFRFYP